jgi:4-hydroxy-2-oxoglutarate aldolase
MIVGTGCEATHTALNYTLASQDLGADAALVISPHYFKKQLTDEALFQYYIDIANNSDGFPIILYNAPQFTGINLKPSLIVKLSHHPGIVGIKDSSGNMDQISEIISTVAKDFQVLVGSAETFYFSLCLGAVGGILGLANIVPNECVKVFQLFKANEHQKAQNLHKKLIPLAKTVGSKYGVPGLKYAMDKLGYFGGEPRKPLLPIDEKVKNEIDKLLQDLVNLLNG